MSKYLIKVAYTESGAKGVLKEGGTSRKKAVEQIVQSVGGRVEAFYFAMGETDAYVLLDAPDAASVTAASMTVAASGAARLQIVSLLSPEEVDQAAKKSVSYRAPGV